jgi:hypothetical protein
VMLSDGGTFEFFFLWFVSEWVLHTAAFRPWHIYINTRLLTVLSE